MTVLELHRKGYRVWEIARALDMRASDVTKQILAARRPEAWAPTPEEIEIAKQEINRAKGITTDLT